MKDAVIIKTEVINQERQVTIWKPESNNMKR